MYTKEKEICPASISKINFARNILYTKEKEICPASISKINFARNILYTKEKEICPASISKINLDCEKQIILLIIPNEEKEEWCYPAVKKFSALLHGITWKT